ncbi:hypothetical protein FZEAL_8093 [Fusarium zealandicum]|uniref:Uncharacterized protein n=1 Tax=Fusarium zealandicum TaxID=1053134 RepID=A0A8H4XI06_9HYPO|nr:hypothetical protein FZEAL_8093 [Fusarium zealandicum]
MPSATTTTTTQPATASDKKAMASEEAISTESKAPQRDSAGELLNGKAYQVPASEIDTTEIDWTDPDQFPDKEDVVPEAAAGDRARRLESLRHQRKEKAWLRYMDRINKLEKEKFEAAEMELEEGDYIDLTGDDDRTP